MSGKPKKDNKSKKKSKTIFEKRINTKRFRRGALVQLNESIPWEEFRPILIRTRKKSSQGGRPPYDEIFMFKCYVLQRLYRLSDEDVEFQIADRYSFQQFLGLTTRSPIPDHATFNIFRHRLKNMKLNAELFALFKKRLTEQRIVLKKGLLADAAFFRIPISPGSRMKALTTVNEPAPRRGRPPKAARPIEEAPTIGNESAPRRRGRPPKVARPIEETPAPRRRGRPPKAARPIEEAPAPRRGRPPKQGASARKRATV